MPQATPTPQPPSLRRENNEISVAYRQLRALEALPLYQLPAELVLLLLKNLTFKDYPAFISATLPLLRRRNIVHNMSTERLRSLLIRRRHGLFMTDPSLQDRRTNGLSLSETVDRALVPNMCAMALRWRGIGFDGLPNELKGLIIQSLGPIDKITLVLAWHRFPDSDIESMTHEEIPPF